MAHTNAAIGHGTVITWETGLFGNILDFDWSGISRAAIDSTHMGSGDVKTFLPGGTYDPGTLNATVQFNTSTTTDAGALTIDALMTNVAQSCTVDFQTAAYNGSAFITDMGIASGDEDIITQSITLKFSGAIATAAT